LVWTPFVTSPTTSFGNLWVTAKAVDFSGRVSFARRKVFVNANVVDQSYTGELTDGVSITGNTVTIALFAPAKTYVAVKGTWNADLPNGELMHRDGDWWWYQIELPGGDYSYQYEVYDQSMDWVKTLADPFSTDVAWKQPGTDWESGTYYYARSLFSVGAAPYQWTDADFQRPPPEKAVVYELHVGDFSGDP
ncbi:MAG: hypothetical protein GY869_23690, partial [Planctomycetes bacterium]|nr:hypothetical protein [Planctomycetota bacterium]